MQGVAVLPLRRHTASVWHCQRLGDRVAHVFGTWCDRIVKAFVLETGCQLSGTYATMLVIKEIVSVPW